MFPKLPASLLPSSGIKPPFSTSSSLPPTSSYHLQQPNYHFIFTETISQPSCAVLYFASASDNISTIVCGQPSSSLALLTSPVSCTRSSPTRRTSPAYTSDRFFVFFTVTFTAGFLLTIFYTLDLKNTTSSPWLKLRVLLLPLSMPARVLPRVVESAPGLRLSE